MNVYYAPYCTITAAPSVIQSVNLNAFIAVFIPFCLFYTYYLCTTTIHPLHSVITFVSHVYTVLFLCVIVLLLLLSVSSSSIVNILLRNYYFLWWSDNKHLESCSTAVWPPGVAVLPFLILLQLRLPVCLTDCPTRNVGKTPPPHRVEKKWRTSAKSTSETNTHVTKQGKQPSDTPSNVSFSGSASALCPHYHRLASARWCTPVELMLIFIIRSTS